MTARYCFIAASLAGLSGVILGAFGSHALQGSLPAALLKIWHTAVLYQFVHTLALMFVGILLIQRPALKSLNMAAMAFALCIIFFSGSLYLLALTQVSKLGVITPLGGILFMIGWAALLVSSIRWHQSPD